MSIIKNFIILLFITTFVGQVSAEESEENGHTQGLGNICNE